jgi:hypothetical protein
MCSGTLRDYALLARRENETKKQFITSFSCYLNALYHAGYVARIQSPGRETVWRLTRWTGAIAPSWTAKSRTVYDHNTGELFSSAKSKDGEWSCAK